MNKQEMPPAFTCAETQALFDDALDDTLTGRAKDSFDQHVATCFDCNAEFSGLKKSTEILTFLPAPSCSEDFVANCLAEYCRQTEPERVAWKWVGVVILLAAASATLTLLFQPTLIAKASEISEHLSIFSKLAPEPAATLYAHDFEKARSFLKNVGITQHPHSVWILLGASLVTLLFSIRLPQSKHQKPKSFSNYHPQCFT